MHWWNSRKRERDWARLDGLKVEIKHFCIWGWRVEGEGGFHSLHLTTSWLCRPSTTPSHLFSSLITRSCWCNHPHLHSKAHPSVPLEMTFLQWRVWGALIYSKTPYGHFNFTNACSCCYYEQFIGACIPKKKKSFCTPSSTCNVTWSASKIALLFIWRHHTLLLLVFTS